MNRIRINVTKKFQFSFINRKNDDWTIYLELWSFRSMFLCICGNFTTQFHGIYSFVCLFFSRWLDSYSNIHIYVVFISAHRIFSRIFKSKMIIFPFHLMTYNEYEYEYEYIQREREREQGHRLQSIVSKMYLTCLFNNFRAIKILKIYTVFCFVFFFFIFFFALGKLE